MECHSNQIGDYVNIRRDNYEMNYEDFVGAFRGRSQAFDEYVVRSIEQLKSQATDGADSFEESGRLDVQLQTGVVFHSHSDRQNWTIREEL